MKIFSITFSVIVLTVALTFALHWIIISSRLEGQGLIGEQIDDAYFETIPATFRLFFRTNYALISGCIAITIILSVVLLEIYKPTRRLILEGPAVLLTVLLLMWAIETPAGTIHNGARGRMIRHH